MTKSRYKGRFALSVGLVAITLLICVLGVWGTQARISGAVIASGIVEVERNKQVVQHLDGGVVSAIHVRDGDLVQAGDPLITLKNDDIVSELAILEIQLFEARATGARLEAERDSQNSIDISDFNGLNRDEMQILNGQISLFEAKQKSFDQEVEQIDEQIVHALEQIQGVVAQITALKKQLALLEEEMATKETLNAKGLVVDSLIIAQQREHAQLEGHLGELSSLIGQHNSTIASHRLTKIRAEITRREEAISELRTIESKRLELVERINILRRQLTRTIVTAPANGHVFESTVYTVGSVITSANPIMFIIPQDDPLIIKARASAQDIDHIVVGQDAKLVFSALDLKMLPEVRGVVDTVSADAITDEANNTTYFAVEIVPLMKELEKLGDQEVLPGMPVEAYIMTGERSPLDYLTQPLMNYFYRAFRES